MGDAGCGKNPRLGQMMAAQREAGLGGFSPSTVHNWPLRARQLEQIPLFLNIKGRFQSY
jgi:hypothetical protein